MMHRTARNTPSVTASTALLKLSSVNGPACLRATLSFETGSNPWGPTIAALAKIPRTIAFNTRSSTGVSLQKDFTLLEAPKGKDKVSSPGSFNPR